MKAFLDRPPEGDWPNLWLDAISLEGRKGGRIVSVAAIIAVAANTEGRREIIGLGIGPSEAETFWADFLKRVTRRGLRGVKLVISDAHEGLKAAIQRVVGATWQRCRVLHGGGDNRLLLLTSLFSHSSGFIECSFVRCCGAKVVMLGLVH